MGWISLPPSKEDSPLSARRFNVFAPLFFLLSFFLTFFLSFFGKGWLCIVQYNTDMIYKCVCIREYLQVRYVQKYIQKNRYTVFCFFIFIFIFFMLFRLGGGVFFFFFSSSFHFMSVRKLEYKVRDKKGVGWEVPRKSIAKG